MNEDPATPDSVAPDPAPGDSQPAGNENLFAVALAKNSGGDSFPVLNAFQRFLDQERERARRRVFTMAVCFTGAMVVLLLVFGILFATFFSRMMVRNERQQDRLLDLVVAGLPGARPAEPAPAAAAPKGTSPENLSREELLDLLRRMNAGQAAASGSAPAAVDVPVVPVPSAADAARTPRKTGVISSPFRRDQEAKEAAEEAARRARAAAAQPAAVPAPAPVPSPVPAPAPEAGSGSVALAPDSSPAAEAPAPAPAPEAPAPAAETPDGRRTIAVKPRRRMKVPEGFSTDRAEVQASTGASVPFRLLVPVPDASR